MLKRLLFGQTISDTRFQFSGSIYRADGIPRSVDTSYEELMRNFAITNNKGNMVIGESVQRLFEFDREKSVYTNIGKLYSYIGNRDKFSKIIQENFDGIVLAMANCIRPGVDLSYLVKIIDAIEDVDIFVFGAGMQQSLDNIAQLKPGTVDFLKILNEKAKIFAVRGDRTRDFLVSNGFSNAISLGCLSIYLYPENIINLEPVSARNVKNILSAGYLSNPKRLAKLAQPFANEQVTVDYVVQGKIFDLVHSQSFYNDATGEFKGETIRAALKQKFGNKLPQIPFDKFYYFNNVDAWRHCCSRYDLYLGDRLHGGIAALQAGIPAIILYEDARVQELTEFWGIPALSLPDFSRLSLEQLITESLSFDALALFKQQYLSKLTKLVHSLDGTGLVLANKNISSLINSYKSSVDGVKDIKAA